jgi:carbamoyl-phosphate synthase large subunit
MRESVVVTGAGGPAAIAIIQNLRQLGYYVKALDASQYSAGFRLAHTYATIPLPGHTLMDALLKEIRYYDILIPTVDDELLFLAERQEIIMATGTKLWLPSLVTLKNILDKSLFAQINHDWGIPHPLTSEKTPSFPGPWVIKPRVGRGSRDIIFLEDDGKEPPVLTPGVIIQQQIKGQEFTCDFLVGRDNQIKSLVPRYRLETKAGISTKGQTFSPLMLEDTVRKAIKAFNYQGVGNLQGFILPNNEVVTLEINPRFSGGLPLSLGADPYFVEKYILEVLGKNHNNFPPAKEFPIFMSRYYANVITEVSHHC